MNRLLVRLAWLMPKCKWAVKHGDEKYARVRMSELIAVCEEIIDAYKVSAEETMRAIQETETE